MLRDMVTEQLRMWWDREGAPMLKGMIAGAFMVVAALMLLSCGKGM